MLHRQHRQADRAFMRQALQRRPMSSDRFDRFNPVIGQHRRSNDQPIPRYEQLSGCACEPVVRFADNRARHRTGLYPGRLRASAKSRAFRPPPHLRLVLPSGGAKGMNDGNAMLRAIAASHSS